MQHTRKSFIQVERMDLEGRDRIKHCRIRLGWRMLVPDGVDVEELPATTSPLHQASEAK